MSQGDAAGGHPPQTGDDRPSYVKRLASCGALFVALAGVLQYFIGDGASLRRRASGLLLTAVAAALFTTAGPYLVRRRPLRGGGFASAATGVLLAAVFVLWGHARGAEPSRHGAPQRPVIATMAGALPDVVRGSLPGYQVPLHADGLAADRDGSVLVAAGETVTSVTRDRTVDRLAGRDHVIGDSGDGGPAADALFGNASDVVRPPDGSIVVADGNAARLRRIGTDGVITAIPDRGKVLRYPAGLGVDRAGRIYVADSSGNRVFRLDPGGRFTVVAGTGEAGDGGDGGAAVAARLNGPTDVEAEPDGSLLIADSGNARIRLVRPDGVIRTVAGAGPGRGLTRDGVAATDARLGDLLDVAAGPDHRIYIADTASNRVRSVGPDGVVRTLAGDGGSADRGDGGPPETAGLDRPSTVTVAPDGVVFVGTAGRLRVIGPPRRIGRWAAEAPSAGAPAAAFSGELRNEPGGADVLVDYLEEHTPRPVALDVRIEMPDVSGPGTTDRFTLPGRCFDLPFGRDIATATCEQVQVVVEGSKNAIPYARGYGRLLGSFTLKGTDGPHMDTFTVILAAVS